jgi:alkylation response protein AidB-like acyl-CoA dehydrogenase
VIEADPRAFLARHSAGSIAEVLSAAAVAPEPALAFWVALQAALHQLVPRLPAGRSACLCISEEGGGHPRQIKTTIVPDGGGWILDGVKLWSTGGVIADDLIVVARAGERDGRPDLRAAIVAGDATGLVRQPLPGIDILPSLEHARVQLRGVRVPGAALLPGDAYTEIVRPFRTVEDIYVSAAVAGWVLGALARGGADAAARSPWVAAALGLPVLTELPPAAAATHIALDAWQQAFARLASSLDGTLLDPVDAERWQRDRAVLHIAARARAARAHGAWGTFGLAAQADGQG